MQDAKKSPKNRRLGTIAQLCRAISSQLRHVSTIGKKLLNSDISSTCPRNMVNLGLLAAENLRRWAQGATYIRQGDHQVGRPHSSFVCFCSFSITCWWNKVAHDNKNNINNNYNNSLKTPEKCKPLLSWLCCAPTSSEWCRMLPCS